MNLQEEIYQLEDEIGMLQADYGLLEDDYGELLYRIEVLTDALKMFAAFTPEMDGLPDNEMLQLCESGGDLLPISSLEVSYFRRAAEALR